MHRTNKLYKGYKNFKCGNCEIVQRLPEKAIWATDYCASSDFSSDVHYFFECPDCGSDNEIPKEHLVPVKKDCVATLVDDNFKQ